MLEEHFMKRIQSFTITSIACSLSALLLVGCSGEAIDVSPNTQYQGTDYGNGAISSQAQTQHQDNNGSNTTEADTSTGSPDTTTPAPVEDTTPTPVEDTETTPVEDTGPEPVEDTSEPEPEPEDVEEPVVLCGNGTCDPEENCTSCAQDCPVCQPGAGDLLITEIMQNPKALSDDTGEWIEILHIGDQPVELAGVLMRDDDQDQHYIAPATSLVVSPGDYVILGASDDVGGVTPDYVWFDYSLGNGSDSIVLEANGVIIDAVSWDNGASFPDPNGASMSLSPEVTTTSGNDEASNWCAGQSAFASGDLGSPGEANPTCVVCGDGTCASSEACETCPSDCGSCTPCDQGATATDEVCNGIDDDCDGSVDEGVACDDGIACTEDFCDGASGCSAEPADGKCYINGECYNADDSNPTNTCEACDPGVTKDNWTSTLISFDCEDGDPCTENEKCVAGFCIFGSAVPGDNFELSEGNEIKEDATVLGDISDSDDFPSGVFNASLWPEGDMDWYTFHDEDIITNISFYRPKVELIAPADADYRLCAFTNCDNGEIPEIVDCGDSAVEWSAEEDLYGCCSSGSNVLSVKMTVHCTFQGALSDSGDIHVRVENQSEEWSCGEYELSWGDD